MDSVAGSAAMRQGGLGVGLAAVGRADLEVDSEAGSAAILRLGLGVDLLAGLPAARGTATRRADLGVDSAAGLSVIPAGAGVPLAPARAREPGPGVRSPGILQRESALEPVEAMMQMWREAPVTLMVHPED
ncbi:MAG: hypothetical protein ACKV0T_17650 [Planctomycetales bacterium]